MLATILTSLIQMLTTVFSSLASIGAFFAFGKRVGEQEATIEALKEAQNANIQANTARRASTRESDSGGLLKDDGFKRD